MSGSVANVAGGSVPAVFGGDDHTLDVIQRMRPLISVIGSCTDQLSRQIDDMDEDVAVRVSDRLGAVSAGLVSMERELDGIAAEIIGRDERWRPSRPSARPT